MKRQMQCRGWVMPVVWALLAGSIARASESPIRLMVDQQRFLTGEPIVLRVRIDTSGMTNEQLGWALDKTTEIFAVERDDGTTWGVRTAVSSSQTHPRPVNNTIEDTAILQHSACWRDRPGHTPPKRDPEFLAPGRYEAYLYQSLLRDGATTRVESNRVAFGVVEPQGRDLEAWEVVLKDPVLLRYFRDSFPTPFQIRPSPYTSPDRTPEALARNIEFAKKYIDTPYGQFAAVNCAMAASKGGPFEVVIDLYPTLGRLIELRPQQDFVTQHARFLYLYLDSILEEAFNAKKGLATMNEFKSSLSSSPTLLLSEKIDRMIGSYEEDIARPGPLLLDQLEAYQKRLIDRDELPSDPAVRERRRNIALGRMDAP